MRASTLIAAAVILASACGAEDGERAGSTVRDSAGVRLVTSMAPAWGNGAGWRVDTSPMVSIGDASQQDAVLLVEVGGARILQDGRIVVASGGDRAVLFFTAKGARDGRFGRDGSGPGEFRGVSLVGVHHDSLLLWDAQLDRATVAPLDGGTPRILEFGKGDTTGASRFGFAPLDIFSDGALLLAGRTGASSSDRGGVRRDPVPLRRAGWDGTIGQQLAVVPGSENIVVTGAGFVTVFERPFGHRTHTIAAGSELLVSTGDFDGVMLFDSLGTLTAIWRLDRARRAVPPSDVEAVSARQTDQLNQLPPEYAEPIHEIVKDLGFPTVLPPFDAILRDATGATWLRNDVGPVLRDSIPRSWTVLDPEGRWLGEVTMPLRVEVQQITADRVLGVWRDADGVEHLRLYRLRR